MLSQFLVISLFSGLEASRKGLCKLGLASMKPITKGILRCNYVTMSVSFGLHNFGLHSLWILRQMSDFPPKGHKAHKRRLGQCRGVYREANMVVI